ncbi:MAG: hypothetical protein HYT12_04015 [Candidatus Liptonbacteria bacterium]|nr:hypothetical protein [Candidatus Liptonbacteria bacterium]
MPNSFIPSGSGGKWYLLDVHDITTICSFKNSREHATLRYALDKGGVLAIVSYRNDSAPMGKRMGNLNAYRLDLIKQTFLNDVYFGKQAKLFRISREKLMRIILKYYTSAN